MRFSKMVSIFVLILCAVALASTNKLGIHDVNRVKFESPVRIGTQVLPAGEYVVRHSMAGEDHVMNFERVGRKEVFHVKCTLVPLSKKAENNGAVYETTSTNERVLRELTFGGDTAKHVF